MAAEMQCVIAPEYTDPTNFKLSRLPIPQIQDSTEVQFRVDAASINPIDIKKASGQLKRALQDEFPYKIGYDAAGTVTAVGADVKAFKVGDEIYVRLPETHRGSWAEYAVCPEQFLALKPKSAGLSEAASLPLTGMTALQAFRKYNGSLEGKTVFIPAGLSGTGAYACQLAKNVFKAGTVITTVSTSKVSKIPELLGEGVVDQIIDYTKEDPSSVIPGGSVDFLLDTMGQAMDLLSLMVPHTGTIISISTLPSGTQLQNSMLMKRPDKPRLPFWGAMWLNGQDAIRKLRAWRWSVRYEYFFLIPRGSDLTELAGFVDQGILRPVVGRKVNLGDIEVVREAAATVYDAKGGVGKTVIQIP